MSFYASIFAPPQQILQALIFSSLFVYQLFGLDSTKPVFTTYDNSLALGIYADFNKKSFTNIYALGFYYAQPNTFFRINGRISLELEAFLPINYHIKRQIIFGTAQDIILPIYKSLYTGVGIGIYIRSNEGDDGRIGSSFSFGERIFVGFYHRLTHKTTIFYECIIKHYSNGNLERPNIGYNYLGFSAGVAF